VSTAVRTPRKHRHGSIVIAWLSGLVIAGTGCMVGAGPAGATSTSQASSATTTRPRLPAGGPVFPGTDCAAFPADNVLNTPVTGLPVNKDSAMWLKTMSAGSTYLHPDYGPSGTKIPYGIPWQIVKPSQALVPIKFLYASESDKGPYPFSSSTPIEGGPNAGGDRHALMVNPSTCKLFELYDAYYHPNNLSTAGSGAIWSLGSNALRHVDWTSADAAGLPITPLLVNYDEVHSGVMDHAIRFTVNCSSQAFIWPARHEAGSSDKSCPPMGARFRLNAGFTLPASECAAMCQTVIKTMKVYGLILADNGSNWYFQGTADTRWTYAEVDQLKQIPAKEFVAVDESCLQVAANSGEAYQPGTAGWTQHCG
jgi:hypothetical protein